jgi:hypothetical protein
MPPSTAGWKPAATIEGFNLLTAALVSFIKTALIL